MKYTPMADIGQWRSELLDTGHASWLFYVLAGRLTILIVTVLIPKPKIVLQ